MRFGVRYCVLRDTVPFIVYMNWVFDVKLGRRDVV